MSNKQSEKGVNPDEQEPSEVSSADKIKEAMKAHQVTLEELDKR